MDYKELSERLKCPQIRECPINEKIPSCRQCQNGINKQAATAITDLLDRAEAAEARCKRLEEARERANEAAHKWEGRCKILETRLETAEKMVKEYQDVIVPGYRERAEKAEKEIERLKDIMRDHGIMVIPSKYPGCKSEWNLPSKR